MRQLDDEQLLPERQKKKMGEHHVHFGDEAYQEVSRSSVHVRRYRLSIWKGKKVKGRILDGVDDLVLTQIGLLSKSLPLIFFQVVELAI